MIDFATITQEELVTQIKATLDSRPYEPGYSHFDVAPGPTEPAAYLLILGAGFSCGVVPLVRELMLETIGDYYYPDQDMSSMSRGSSALRKNSASFWAEYNNAAKKRKLPCVILDRDGLPTNSGEAYQALFMYDVVNARFTREAPKYKKPTFLEHIQQQRALVQSPEESQSTGKRFVDGFLRYVLDRGAEHGFGSSGRSLLNPAHMYLGALLEAQQLGLGWTTCAFCRTIFTTNFDTLLQNGLQMVNLTYRITDRPERGLDHSDFRTEEGPIHLVYTHGSILRHNPASSTDELSALEKRNVHVLRGCLESHDVIVIGHSGWDDGIMASLRGIDSRQHKVYWCDVSPQPATHIASSLAEHPGDATYVDLGKSGADGIMRALYETLIPKEAQRDPVRRYRQWNDLVWNR